MNILVVDNDPIFLKFVEKFLLEEGHNVLSAKDGLTALDALKGFTPDVFFVDYVMPNIDGKMFCQILKNDPQYKSAYLVLLSAVAAEEWTDLKDLGADACIAKGPLSNMKGYLAEVLNNPAASAEYCAAGNIIGLQDVFPRLITRELLDSKKHFQLLLQKMSEGILEINADDRVVFVNPAARKIVGRPRNTILGTLVADIFPPGESPAIKTLLAEKGRRDGPAVPARLISIGQQFVTVEAVPLMSADEHALIILNDISDCKRAEANLTETNDFLKSILNSAYSISIVSTDLDQNIIFWNRGAEELFGYTAEEVVGKHKISLLYPGTEEDKLAAGLRHQLTHAKKEVSCELAEKTKEGRIRWMRLHLSPRVDNRGEVIGILGIGEDISQRKAAETAVLESEKRFRLFSELAEEGIVIHDHGDIIDANEAMARIFGYETAELIGLAIEDLVGADTWGVILENIASGYEKHVEVRGIKKDRRTFHCLMAGRSYPYRGKALRVATFRDISARKKLENQLYQAQKMRALGTLAGGVAHDFNNLLMGIQGRASIMKMKIESSEPILEHLVGIEESIQSAAALTKQLLGFARGGKYEVMTIDLNAFVKSQCRLFSRTRKDITIHEHFEKALWSVEADRGQLEQVLLNILVNAWQAMPGGGELFIQTENFTVDESLAQAHDVNPGKFVRVSIRDTGVGMDAEVVERIFDPFFTTKEIGRGTGLGLASVYGILHNHGGFVEVATEKSKGSTFSICLPATEKKAPRETAPDESVIRGNETLLLVDDEKIILDVGREILEILGYDVLLAADGKEALEIYRRNADRIKMVILDMIMPAMDGREIYKKLKSMDPDVRVLLSSGYSVNGEAAEILEMGCDGFIQKPFNMGDLSAKIRDILDGG